MLDITNSTQNQKVYIKGFLEENNFIIYSHKFDCSYLKKTSLITTTLNLDARMSYSVVLKGTDRYRGFLLAPTEGFGLRKRAFLCP